MADKNGDEYTYPPEGGSLDQDGTVVYTVTVTFDSQGGSEVASKDINVNNPVEEPANPHPQRIQLPGLVHSGKRRRTVGFRQACRGGYDFVRPVVLD